MATKHASSSKAERLHGVDRNAGPPNLVNPLRRAKPELRRLRFSFFDSLVKERLVLRVQHPGEA
jgi:hypothetical protein